MTRAAILIVDDDPSVLSALKRLLRIRDLKVDTTSSPKEALKWMVDYTYAVVISDQVMPEMNGVDFLSRVKEIQPTTYRMLMSAHGSEELIKESVNKVGIFRYLAKPWDKRYMLESVKDAFERFFLVRDQVRAYESEIERNKELHNQYKKIGKKVLERDERILAMSHELEEKFLYSVKLMTQLLQNFSPSLYEHSNRVALLAAELASEFKLSGREILEIEIAASLHDIGKIGLSHELINKRLGELSETEELRLLTHVQQGEKLLKDIPGFEGIATMIKHYREHMDGTGYPFKLKADAIPLGAKIIAVADAFDDALHGHSVFSQPNSESALVYMKAKAKTFFDPKVVSALERYVSAMTEHKGEEIQVSLADLEAGMVLSRDIVTASGREIVTKGTVLETQFLIKLLDLNKKDPIHDSIFVFVPEQAAS